MENWPSSGADPAVLVLASNGILAQSQTPPDFRAGPCRHCVRRRARAVPAARPVPPPCPRRCPSPRTPPPSQLNRCSVLFRLCPGDMPPPPSDPPAPRAPADRAAPHVDTSSSVAGDPLHFLALGAACPPPRAGLCVIAVALGVVQHHWGPVRAPAANQG